MYEEMYVMRRGASEEVPSGIDEQHLTWHCVKEQTVDNEHERAVRCQSARLYLPLDQLLLSHDYADRM